MSAIRRLSVERRREARERALALLYEAEAKSVAPSEVARRAARRARPVRGRARERASGDTTATSSTSSSAAVARGLDTRRGCRRSTAPLLRMALSTSCCTEPDVPDGGDHQRGGRAGQAVLHRRLRPLRERRARRSSPNELPRPPDLGWIRGGIAVAEQPSAPREPVLVSSHPDREAGPVRPARTGRMPRGRTRTPHRRPRTGAFSLPGAGSWTPTTCQRAVWRIAHEIIERNHGLDDVVLVGLQTGGVPLAARLGRRARADRGRRACRSARSTSPSTATTSACGRCCPRRSPTSPSTSTGAIVVLVDDVLFTGRTVRAALDALTDYGRPRAVQLAVMVDRGHRELPIRPDYVGKNLPTRRDEVVDVQRRRRRPRRDGRSADEAPALDRRPRRRDGIEEMLDLTDSFVEVSAPRHPEGAGAAGQDGRVALLRGLHPHPALASRPRPSACRPTR